MKRDDGLTPKRFDETEAQVKAVFGLTLAVAIIILLVSLAGLGLLGWAVMELVQWVTSRRPASTETVWLSPSSS